MNKFNDLHSGTYDKTHCSRGIGMTRYTMNCVRRRPFSTRRRYPVDTTHVGTNHFEQYVAECPSSVNNNRYTFEPRELEQTNSSRNVENTEKSSSEENWDEVDYASSYDPLKNTENRSVLRCITGKTKFEKKKFKEAERLRFQNLSEKNGSSHVPKLKRLIQTTVHAHEQTKAMLHKLLFPEHVGIDELSIHNVDECLMNINFHKLSVNDPDIYSGNI